MRLSSLCDCPCLRLRERYLGATSWALRDAERFISLSTWVARANVDLEADFISKYYLLSFGFEIRESIRVELCSLPRILDTCLQRKAWPAGIELEKCL